MRTITLSQKEIEVGRMHQNGTFDKLFCTHEQIVVTKSLVDKACELILEEDAVGEFEDAVVWLMEKYDMQCNNERHDCTHK